MSIGAAYLAPIKTVASKGTEAKADYECVAYQSMLPAITTHYDLMEGARALRAKFTDYLQKFPFETADGYASRANAATLFNESKKAVEGMCGLILKREVQFLDDGNETFKAQFEKCWENIDGAGNNGNVFTYQTLINQFAGHVFIVIDAPPIPEGRDKQKEANWRPYWQIYDARQGINFKTMVINNQVVLSHLVFKTCTHESAGEFGETEVKRFISYRLLLSEAGQPIGVSLTKYRYQDDDEKNELFIENNNGKPLVMSFLKEIPIAIAGDLVSVPPLIDLYDKNIEHFDDYSDYRKGKSFAGLVVPWVRDGQVKGDALGWDVLVELTGQYAEFGFAETTGQALAARRQALEDVKAEMAELGLALLVDDTQGNVTATKALIDHTQKSSALTQIATSLKDALEKAIEFTALFMNYTKEDAFSVDLGFQADQLVLSADMTRILAQMGKDNQLSIEDLLNILKLGGVMPHGFDIKEALEKLAKQKAVNPTPAVPASAIPVGH